MYCAGHIITSAAAAAVTSKKLNLKFIPLAVIFILLNCIDYDHLLYYYKDDGAANSLALHPLHLYAGVIFFTIFVIGLFKTQFLKLLFAITGGISLHLTLDAFAHSIGYHVPTLIGLDFINIAILFVLVKKLQPHIPLKGFIPYMVFVMCGTTFVQWYMNDIMKLIPQENMIVYVASPTMTLLSAIGLGLLFKKFA